MFACKLRGTETRTSSSAWPNKLLQIASIDLAAKRHQVELPELLWGAGPSIEQGLLSCMLHGYAKQHAVLPPPCGWREPWPMENPEAQEAEKTKPFPCASPQPRFTEVLRFRGPAAQGRD